MYSDLNIIRDGGFTGYNNTLPPEFLKKGVLAYLKNGMITGGRIKNRDGTVLIGNDSGNDACQGIKGVRFADGTKERIAVFGGIIKKHTGSGDWTAISGSYTLSATAQVDIVVANNRVYFFDGINTVPCYDGSSVTTKAGIPVGKYARWFFNQLHVAGISGSPNTIYSSVLGDPETFSGGISSSFDVNPNDGDYITGLSELKSELLIFKFNRVWSATNLGSAALSISNLNERLTGIGTLTHRGIVNVGNDLLYPTFQGNKVHIRSLTRTRYGTIVDNGIISGDIKETLANVNTSKLDLIASAFDGQLAYFAFPASGQTYNTNVAVYDVGEQSWISEWTGIYPSCFDVFSISTTPQLYFGEARADSKVYVFDDSVKSDNGEAIDFLVRTRRYGGLQPELQKKWFWIYVTAKESGDFDVDIDYSASGFDFSTLDTLNLSGSGSVLDSMVLDESRLGETDIKRKRFPLPKVRDYYVQFEMSNSSTDADIEIRNWELYYKKYAPINT